MRTWLSIRTPFRGVRVGVAIPTSAARVYQVSATGLKVWRAESAAMLIGLAIWLFVSRDQEGRLSENFLLVTFMVFGLRYIFRLAVVALFPPSETPPK